MADDNFHKLSLNGSFERVAKVAEERQAFNKAMDNLIAQDADLIDPAAEWQAGYEAGVEAAAKALEADAKLCDCFAFEEDECGCGAWNDYKDISSQRAIEIVRALATSPE